MGIQYPERQSTRLRGFDYSQLGWYFVTICTYRRQHLFGSIVPVQSIVGATRESPETPIMQLNQIGNLVFDVWQSLPHHHPVNLSTIQIMPNHIHFIIRIMGGSRPAPTLGTIVGIFKSQSSRQIHQIPGNSSLHVWQRNYHDHIIRDNADLHRI